MSPVRPTPDMLNAASDAVVEFAIVALEPEFLRWEKSVNMRVAQCVWNAHSLGTDPPAAPSRQSPLKTLVERLATVRATRWGEETFLVLGLDVRHEDGEILFTFDLTWDDGASFHPCEIAWKMNIAGPSALN